MKESDDRELFKEFYHIITTGRKNNSYKFALARSILEFVKKNEIDIKENIKKNKDTPIHYSVFAEDFFRYYWHQVKFRIPQNYNSNSIPRAVKIVIEIYKKPQPEKFEMVDESVKKSAIKKILSCVFNKFDSKTSQVVPRFQTIMIGKEGIEKETFYKNDEPNKKILVNPIAMTFFIKNRVLLEKFVILEWAKFLDGIKTAPGIISKIEDPVLERSSLKPFERILKKHFKKCFYCNEELSKLPENVRIHVDHFIPRSYVGDDKMWNFVLTCSRCNTSKSDSLAVDFKSKFFKNRKDFKNKIPKLRKSLKDLDEKTWKKQITQIYDNCLDYGFTQIRKEGILRWKND